MEMNNFSIDSNVLIINVNRPIFDKEPILKTCYIFQDRCYISVESENNSTIKVKVIAKNEKINLKEISKQFNNELIDQQIRYENEILFSDIRKLIVEQAFKPINYSELKSKINKE